MNDQGKLETTWNDLRQTWLNGRDDRPPCHPEGQPPLRFRNSRARRAASLSLVPVAVQMSGTA